MRARPMLRPGPLRRPPRWAVIALAIFAARDALGAGLVLSPRGVRPLARAGAFVAGADDANALSYNPAGLAFAPNEVLADAGLVLLESTYQRRVFAGSEPMPTVN